MDDKLSSSKGRDKYVRNVLRNKNLQTRQEFKDLMKQKFDGQERMYSLIMLSYYHVTKVRGPPRKRLPRKTADDTTEIAKREAPVTVERLFTTDDLGEDTDVPATTSAAGKEPTNVLATTTAAKKDTTKFIAL